MDHQSLRDRIYSYGPRKVGAFFLLLGIAMLYLCAYEPIQQAESGAAEVKGLSAKGTMVGSMGLMLGLGLLIGGTKVKEIINPQPGQSKVLAYVVGFVIVGAGIGVHYLVKKHIEGLGYEFKF